MFSYPCIPRFFLEKFKELDVDGSGSLDRNDMKEMTAQVEDFEKTHDGHRQRMESFTAERRDTLRSNNLPAMQTAVQSTPSAGAFDAATAAAGSAL